MEEQRRRDLRTPGKYETNGESLKTPAVPENYRQPELRSFLGTRS